MIDLNEMERRARYDLTIGHKCEVVVREGDVDVISQTWRSNPRSGVVGQHVRVSYKYKGKRISRAALLKALS
jgi:hypothetical protein